MEECGPCPVFASFILAFALQMRKKHGKTSVRVRKTSVRVHHHHHHHISVMELGHLLTRSGLTYPEVSSKVCHDSFCQLRKAKIKELKY